MNINEALTSPAERLAVLADLLGGVRYLTAHESSLQVGVAMVLSGECVPFVREAALSGADRVDFLVGDIAIECKIGGSLSEVTRQLHRYAQHGSVRAILLVTTRMRHRALAGTLNGKPIRVLHLLEGAL